MRKARSAFYRKPSNFANGNTRDRQGRIVTCGTAPAASPAPDMTARSGAVIPLTATG